MESTDDKISTSAIVYSAITSCYDRTFQAKVYTKNIKYLLYSDMPRNIKGWDVLPITKKIKGAKPLTNRWYKFFPHELFKEVEYSVYLDGNIRIIGDLTQLLQEFIKSQAAIGVFKHKDRNDICQEIDACIKYKKFDASDLDRSKEQIRDYLSEGMPPSQILTDNGIIFRWHQHPQLKKTMALWWEQLQKYSKRDQISLPYVVWKSNAPVYIWNWSFRKENSYFDIYSHRKSLWKDLKTIVYVYRNDRWWAKFIYKMKKIMMGPKGR